MPATRFPRLLRAAPFLIAFASVNVSVAPATAAPGVRDATVTIPALRSGTLRLPLRSNLVAMSVPPGTPVPDVEIRDASGTWLDVHVDPDHAPDPIEGVHDGGWRYSEPVWVGTLDELEIRTSRRVPIRLHLVNSNGDASRAAAPLRWLGSAWRALTVPRAAEAAVPDQPIVTRKQWGADESWVNGPPGPAESLEAFFVHHTDNANSYSRSSVPALIRGIYRYHTRTRGWSDIGYNFLVDRFGRVYEGRRGSILEPMIGAHARGANEGSTGVALIGNFSSASPPKAMRTALYRLVAWKADLHHTPVVGTTELGGRTYKRISGHRDANSTACPGSAAYGLLKWLRGAALGYGLPKLYEPRVSADVIRPDGDGLADTWRLMSWGSDTLTWSLRIVDSAGSVVHEQTRVGKRLETAGVSGVTWNGTDLLGNPVPNGRYRWTLEARDATGGTARPASGSVAVVTRHLRGALLTDATGTYHVGENALGATVAEPVSALAVVTRSANRTPIPTGPGERSRYSPGSATGPRHGALLRNGTTLLVVTADDMVSPFSSPGVAEALGYSTSRAISVTTKHLTGTTTGPPISDTTRHPTGAFVTTTCPEGVVGCTPQVFRIRATDRIEVRPIAVLGLGVTREVVPALAGDLALPVAVGMIDAPDGTLVRLPAGSLWYVEDGTRRLIRDVALFEAGGERTSRAIAAEWSAISHLPVGDPIR